MKSDALFCFFCGKPIEVLYVGDPEHPEQWAYNDAVVDKLSAGYGSKHDGKSFLIAVCDSCIDLEIKSLEMIFKE